MKFSEIIDQASALLQRRGRLTYRALKLEFALDDEQLDVLKEELIDGQELAVRNRGRGMVITANLRPEPELPCNVPDLPYAWGPIHGYRAHRTPISPLGTNSWLSRAPNADIAVAANRDSAETTRSACAAL